MAARSVIFAHGAFCGGWAFERFRAPFEANGLRCLAPDLRGHEPGAGPSATVGVSMADYAADLAGLIAREPDPPILVGHSLGGLAAQMASARARVRALVLLAPSSPWGVAGGTLEEAISAVSLYGLGAFWTQAIEPDFGAAQAYSLDQMSEAERSGVFARMVPESGRALWETLNWWLDPLMTTSVAASAVKAPVLAVAGERDRVHPPATVAQIAERYGGATLVMDGMSHWLVGEPGWEGVATGVLGWLEERGVL
ncbi:MAG TPA: alpha/beta hydrolase [Caulobacteraceae bacterium]|nr:alpha/beta hydrolase [Caulobacteraceae bacterium]